MKNIQIGGPHESASWAPIDLVPFYGMITHGQRNRNREEYGIAPIAIDSMFYLAFNTAISVYVARSIGFI